MINKFPIGITGLTNYLLVVARKVSNPTAEAERHSFGPSPGNINMVFTTLEPVNYYVDFRDSPDGTALGTLIATFTFDAKSNQIISERRFYTVGGPGASDPADGANTIVDDYFIGKNVSGWFKESFRYLVPDAEWTIARDADGIVTSNTATLINGTVFSTDEVIAIEITYKGALPTSSVGAIFEGTLILTTDTTIDSTHYNKRLKSKGTAATLVHTFPDLTTIPDGKQFYFSTFGGVENQVRILLTGTDRIWWDGFNTSPAELPEIWLGKGEWIWLEKNTSTGTAYLDVIGGHEGISKVGERLSAGFKDHPNCLPEDGRLLDGDEWPRWWYWVKNILSGSNYYTDDTVTGGGWTPTAGKEGQFAIHSSLKKGRMPVTMGYVDKGLADFAGIPGVSESGQVGEFHLIAPNAKKGYSYTGSPNIQDIIGNGDPAHQATQSIDFGTVNAGLENRVKNIKQIFLRRM